MSLKVNPRRIFLKNALITGIGLPLSPLISPFFSNIMASGKRVGIIGLDTSHSVEFTRVLNEQNTSSEYNGYKVVAAYPEGSLDIASAVTRIPEYTEKVKAMGVEIVKSIDELLTKVDVVLLETNDGRRHLEQALPVLKSGKRMFVDKPISASLVDGIAIFEAAKHFNASLFSSSSLRYMTSAQDVVKGKIGKVLGADTYSPCEFEKTHPDFFWYGIHGIELLYTVMGIGCKEVTRIYSENTDIAVGLWAEGRVGTFRGTRSGQHDYGGKAFGETGNLTLGPFGSYEPMLKEIVNFFDTGITPVKAKDTLEILTFMEAADESKKRKGKAISLESVWTKANKEAQAKLKKIL